MRSRYTHMDSTQVELPLQQPLSAMAMHAFLALAGETRPERIPPAIARCTCHALLADVCYLISTPENGVATCFDGFNRVKEEIVNGVTLRLEDLPELEAVLKDGKPRVRNHPDDFTHSTRKTIATLGIVEAAPFCLAPVIADGREMLGVLLLISPYTRRIWIENDQIQLLGMTTEFARILQRVLRESELDDRLKMLEEQPKPSLQSPGEWIVEETGETITIIEPGQTLAEEPVSRTSMLFRQPDSVDIYRAENEMLLFEIANLRGQLEQLAVSTSITASEQTDETARLAMEQIREDLHEMLSPLSAITGYHDLLASESVGTLTTMQQRFLERIRTAAEKLHHAIDHLDLIVQEGGPEPRKPEAAAMISLQKVIEEAFSEHHQIISDRELDVRIQADENLPLALGSEKEIQPVVNKILNSLLSVTPGKSRIQSRLSLQTEADGSSNILWKATTRAETEILPGKELDEFSEYLQENVFSLAERLNCQLWMDSAVHTERQVNLLFATA
jgi:signal transduction histidine kinase